MAVCKAALEATASIDEFLGRLLHGRRSISEGRRPAPCTCRRRRPSSPPEPCPSSSGAWHDDLDEFLCWTGGSVGVPSIVKLSDRLLRGVNGIKRIRAIRFRGTCPSMLDTLGSSTLCSELDLGITGVIRVQFSSLDNFPILVLFSSTREFDIISA